MELEKLSLELSATKAGFFTVEPRVVRGAIGVEHRFALLISDGARLYGFDFCSEATEVDVLRSYLKKFDTKVDVNLVCLSGRATEPAKRLATSYQMQILDPGACEAFFLFERTALKDQ